MFRFFEQRCLKLYRRCDNAKQIEQKMFKVISQMQ